MQYILFAEPVIGAAIGLCLIQTAVYVRAEALCAVHIVNSQTHCAHYVYDHVYSVSSTHQGGGFVVDLCIESGL